MSRFGWRVVAVTLLVAGCLRDTSPLAVVPTTPVASETDGLNQSGTVGERLSEALVVKVTDRFGNPVPNVPVSWAVESGGGTLEEVASETDDGGEAAAAWRLGTVAGPNAAVVNVAGLGTSRFQATARAGAPAQLAKTSGDLQTGTVATTLPDSLLVRVTDRYGNAVDRAVVNWVVNPGGVVGSTTSVANASGLAGTLWTLGNLAGPTTVTASSGSGAQAVFSAVASPGPPASLNKQAGDNQRATVGTALVDSLVIRVTDLFGNAVAGVRVDWAVVGSGGVVSPSTAFTDAVGRAQARWTLPTRAGAQSVRGTVSGLQAAVFGATATAGPPATVIKVRGDGQSGAVGSPLADSLVVSVRDAFDNPVSGVQVSWNVTAGGGSVSPAAATSDAGGEVRTRWTLGANVGTHGVSAITPGLPAVAFAATAGTAAGLNLTIAGATLTQVTQPLSGSVPLIQGRSAHLRVFVQANQTNSARPSVRVRLYSNGVLMTTQTIAAMSASVPLGVSEGQLTQSWNLTVAGSLIQPGLSMLVDADPEGSTLETNEGDNTYPASGLPLALDVRTPAPFNALFIPVRQSVNGLQGDVTLANRQRFLAFGAKVLPFSSIDANLRAVYTTSAPQLQSNNANNAWSMILNEIQALRVAEGGRSNYYGVVRVSYTSGIAGIGYIGWPAALGWDGSDPDGTAAHEWGHNFGRFHAPSCNAAQADPDFPYAQGRIGVYGFDPTTGALYSPSSYYDLMGYCGPSWISDYTFRGILDYRAANPVSGLAALAEEPSLLVWGRIDPDGLVLEPAFGVVTSPVLPEASGPYTLQGLDAAGGLLFSIPFEARPVADTDERHFAFAIPVSQASPERLASLRLTAPGLSTAERRAAPSLAAPGVTPTLEVRRVDGGTVEVRWDAATAPVVMVRDPATGMILSFARGGVASVATDAGTLELVLSDGVRSSVRQILVR